MIKTHFFPPSLPWSKKNDIISLTNILIVFIWLELSQQEYRKPSNWYWAGFAKDTYNIEVGWICRARVSVHPGWDACLHMNDSSSHAVDVCFCCVASAKDNLRAHVNLWKIVKKKKKKITQQQKTTTKDDLMIFCDPGNSLLKGCIPLVPTA